MKLCIAVFAAALLAWIATPAHLFAKGSTTKIVITGGGLAHPIEIPPEVASFDVWTGPGTGPYPPSSFIVDWTRFAAQPTANLPRYQVAFYTERSETTPSYVVTYCFDPKTQTGAVYFPAKNEEWYKINVGSILRGVEGQWFPARIEWEKVARPLIAKARQ
jgi:hypothetical protein